MKNVRLSENDISNILFAISGYRDRLDEEIEKEMKQKEVRPHVIETLDATDKMYEELRKKLLKELENM